VKVIPVFNLTKAFVATAISAIVESSVSPEGEKLLL